MGGHGSGRWGAYSKNHTVEDCLTLNVDKLVRLFRAGCQSSGNLIWTVKSTGEEVSTCGYEFNTIERRLRLIYTISGTREQLNYRINLTTTKPRYGSVRWWMVCPLVKDGRECSRRVRRLYLPPAGKFFGCRQCYNLTYTTCQESHRFDRAFDELAKSFRGTTGKDIRKLLESRP
jgi:hypothetical protein